MAKKRKKSASLAHNAARNGYEGKVIHASLQRAGRNKNLHGHIHENLIKDRINLNPGNAVKGVKASLTRNPNAKTVDIVVKQGKKVVGRIQAKDTAQSLGKTVKQIQGGQYRSAHILGTEETAKKIAPKLAGKGISKQVHSSGISSKTTKALATKAGATGSQGLAKACGVAAKGAAKSGAIVCGGIAVAKGAYDLATGKRELGEVALDVAKETSGGALSAAGASAAATAGGAVVASALASAGIVGAGAAIATVAAPVVIAVGVGWGIKALWDELWD